MRVLFLMVGSVLLGQTLQRQAVLPSSAIFAVTATSGACTVELSESPSYSPLVGGTASQAVNGTTRTLVLGTTALKQNTQHYLRVSVCVGSPLTASFTTGTSGAGSYYPLKAPVNSASWGNRQQAANLDMTGQAFGADPVLGASIKPIAGTKWFTWQTGGATGAIATGTALGAAGDVAGGTGWSGAAQVCNGSAISTGGSGAGNTNPVDCYYDLSSAYTFSNQPWRGVQSLHDFGIIPFGAGSAASAGDRQVSVCILFSGSCTGTPFIITLPQTTVAQVSSGSGDPDGAFPASYPSYPWTGWGSVNVGRERLTTYPVASISGGVATIASPEYFNHFSDQLAAGSKINCNGTLGTVATNVNPTQITVTGIADGASQSCKAYGWGIRFQKVTATGSVNIGTKLKIAGSYANTVQALGNQCQQVPTPAVAGEIGYLCAFTEDSAGFGLIGWVGNNGTVLPFSAVKTPVGASAPNGPNTGIPLGLMPFSFDSTTAGVFYVSKPNTASTPGHSIYKVDCSAAFPAFTGYNLNYAGNMDGSFPASPTDNCTWTNVMPPSSSKDLQAQIAASDSTWNTGGAKANLYGQWLPSNDKITFAGTTGNFGVYTNAYRGFNNGPAWLAVINLTTGNLVNVIHLLDGTGTGGLIRNCLIHAVEPRVYPVGTLAVACNQLNQNSTAFPHGGPWSFWNTMTIKQASGGAFTSNTRLWWPISDVSNTYDTTCPGGLDARWVALGATGTRCYTARVGKGGACNLFPSALELSTFPCPWNGAYSQPFTAYEGMLFADFATGGDSEQMRVVKVTEIDSVTTEIVVQREAVWDSCSVLGANPGGNGANPVAADRHVTGWTSFVTPGQNNSCNVSQFLVDLNGVTPTQEVSYALNSAHYGLGHGIVDDTTTTFISYTGVLNKPTANLADLPTVFTQFAPLKSNSTQGFAGYPSSIGSFTQSYPDRSMAGPSPLYADGNGVSGVVGLQDESVQNAIATRAISNVSGDVWLVGCITDGTILGPVSYKTLGAFGWAGRYTLGEVSGPSSSIAAAPNYSFCVVYKAGECSGGSTVNTCYVKVPKVWPTTLAFVGNSWAISPVVALAVPGGSQYRLADIRSQDYTGVSNQQLSVGLCGPGYWYPYSFALNHPSGKWIIAPGSCAVNGLGPTGALIKIPPFSSSTVQRNGFIQTPVRLPAGSSFARIKFGYTPQFYCLDGRAEVCITDGNFSGLYAFLLSDTLVPVNACASGCTLNVPVIAGRAVYLQRQRSSDGTTWTDQGGVEVIGIE